MSGNGFRRERNSFSFKRLKWIYRLICWIKTNWFQIALTKKYKRPVKYWAFLPGVTAFRGCDRKVKKISKIFKDGISVSVETILIRRNPTQKKMINSCSNRGQQIPHGAPPGLYMSELLVGLKGNLRSKKKLSSNEEA